MVNLKNKQLTLRIFLKYTNTKKISLYIDKYIMI